MLYLVLLTGAISWWSTPNEEIDKPATSMPPMSHCWEWIVVLWLAEPLGQLLAAAFRFDYANHVRAAQRSASSIITVTTGPTPDGLYTGAIAPSWAAVQRVPFRRYYFGAALAAWMCANFVLCSLNSRGMLPSRVIYAAGLLFVSTPLIVAALFGMASVRGEGRRMWRYEEVWMVEPVDAKRAAAEKRVVAAGSEEGKEKVDALDLIEERVECEKLNRSRNLVA